MLTIPKERHYKKHLYGLRLENKMNKTKRNL